MLSGHHLFCLLRSALRHLYDPGALKQSLLIEILGLSPRADPPKALRLALVAAIEALQPKAGVPIYSCAWRTHEVLHRRYAEQCSQRDVADQLGVVARQVRRVEHEAILALAYHLEKKFSLDVHWEVFPGEDISEEEQEEAPVAGGDWAWLREPSLEDLVTLTQLLPSVVELAQHMVCDGQVHLEGGPYDELPVLAVNPVAARQILLCLLSVATAQTLGSVMVSVRAKQRQGEVTIRGVARQLPVPSQANLDNIEMAHHLAKLCGCKLTLSNEEGMFTLSVCLPTLEQIPVLVIEDNADTVHLWQRYALGTRYHLVGASDGEQAFTLASKIAPRLIFLDVMIPRIDGWELLRRLRQHPSTGCLPIVVCTVLSQEQLALALGATAFLRKPINRQTLLTVLDRCLPAPDPSAPDPSDLGAGPASG